MFNSPYFNQYTSQSNVDKINEQINQLENLKKQMQQPPPTNLTQNFQLAPQNKEVIRYANSINEVQRDYVIGDTPYFSKDMSVVWIKNVKGDIKTYELNEIVPKDEKDLMIESLQMQINELRGKINNDEYATNVDTKQSPTNTPKYDESVGTTIEKSEPTSIQKISRSKEK